MAPFTSAPTTQARSRGATQYVAWFPRKLCRTLVRAAVAVDNRSVLRDPLCGRNAVAAAAYALSRHAETRLAAGAESMEALALGSRREGSPAVPGAPGASQGLTGFLPYEVRFKIKETPPFA